MVLVESVIEYHRKKHLLLSLQNFAQANYELIEMSLLRRHHELVQQGYSKTSDPFSEPSCCLSVHSVEPSVLQAFRVVQAAGKVHVCTNGQTVAYFQSYFTTRDESQLILDFVPGVHANAVGLSLDSWIKMHPGLFIGRALLSDKETIKASLGLEYPRVNSLWAEIFL